MSDGSVIIDTKLENKEFKKGINDLSGLAKKALTIITTGAIAKGIKDISTAVISARGDIEQSIGGVETLFKSSANKVIENANNAFKTAGMSANTYMENVTSFSASLLQSVAGDTDKAANIADMAMIDMSDNANKMGTSMESIQNAYQGFAKQNYTMLDNLKLGYGGTKTEMERLLADAQKITGVKYDISNLSDVYNAIHVIQGELEITGTTAKEASETLTGSMSAFKAAWQNFLSGAGDINDVISTGGVALENLVRIAKEAISEINKQLGELLANALQPIKDWINEHQTTLTIIIGVIGSLTAAIIAYTIAQNATNIALGIYDGIAAIATATSAAFGAVMAFITSPITLVVLAIGALITIIVLLVKNWDTIKEKTLEVWNKIKEFLGNVITGIIDWFKELPYKIGYFIGELLGKIIQFGIDTWNWVTTELPNIINSIINWFKELPSKIWTWLLDTINKIGNWISSMRTKVVEGIPQIINNIINFFKELPQNMLNIGRNIVEGLWNGIKNATTWIKNKVKEFAKGILDGMKSALGIHSPSTLFRDKIGKFIALGVGEGFTDNIKSVYKKMQNAVDTETARLSSNLTANNSVDIIRNSNISATLDEINTDREITVNAVTNLDGKVLTQSVNTVNARQKLQYGIA